VNAFMENVAPRQASGKNQRFLSTLFAYHLMRYVKEKARGSEDAQTLSMRLRQLARYLLRARDGRNTKLAEHDMIFIPVHVPAHWIVLILSLPKQTMALYCSLGKSNEYYGDIFGAVRDVLAEAAALEDIPAMAMARTYEYGKKEGSLAMIQQNDGWSCGVAILVVVMLVSCGLRPLLHTGLPTGSRGFGVPHPKMWTRLRKRIAFLILRASMAALPTSAIRQESGNVAVDSDDSECAIVETDSDSSECAVIPRRTKRQKGTPP
jgi:hypothetical protein